MSVHRIVGIAVVEHDGRYLVGVRQPGQSLAGFFEFPGGKCLPDESPRDAAIRECEEESGLVVAPVRELHRAQHTFRLGILDLHFWLCRVAAVDQVDHSHRGFRWVPLKELGSLKFPDANYAVIHKLLAQGDTVPGGEIPPATRER